MGKCTLKNILLMIFFISILIVGYIELKNNLRQIKLEHTKNTPKEISVDIENFEENYATDDDCMEQMDVPEELTNQDEEQPSITLWQAIERKDSYNNELQFYSKDNVVINENIIEITSKKENREDKMYTSGLVESVSTYKYGYFEFTIKISEGKGLFPAIWFLPNAGGALPEIDLFEMIGSKPYTFYGVIHFIQDDVQDSDYFKHEVPIKGQYSVALEWKSESLTWFIDGEEIYTTTKGVPQEYMYIIVNQAIGGNWPGSPDEDTVFPNYFKVDSTRIEPVFTKGRN